MLVSEKEAVWKILDTLKVYGEQRSEVEKEILNLFSAKDERIKSLVNRNALLRKNCTKK